MTSQNRTQPTRIRSDSSIACRYLMFVTNIGYKQSSPVEVVAFHNKRAEVENLIKESNSDNGLTDYPPGQWAMNTNHFQLSMIAYNLNCWLELFEHDESLSVRKLTHRTIATARLRMLYLEARITRHGGRRSISDLNTTSDGGALLLRGVGRRLRLTERLAACFAHQRDQRRVEHRVEQMLLQRVQELALGYEDLNDQEQLKKDPMLRLLTGKKDQKEDLAGKSTLNRLELSTGIISG